MAWKGKVPHTYVIVFFIIVFAAMLTWVIPPGKYVKTTVVKDGKEHTELTFYYKDNLPADEAAHFKSTTDMAGFFCIV